MTLWLRLSAIPAKAASLVTLKLGDSQLCITSVLVDLVSFPVLCGTCSYVHILASISIHIHVIKSKNESKKNKIIISVTGVLKSTLQQVRHPLCLIH